MPSFDLADLTKVFPGPKAANLRAWFEELQKDAPTIAECIECDELPLVAMRPFLEEVDILYPGKNAFDSVRLAMVTIRVKLGVDDGEVDSICLLGKQVDMSDLNEVVFVHIRERRLSDNVIQRVADQFGTTFISEADKNIKPMDWCQYCRLLDAIPLGNWRGFAWLAPLEDVQSAICKGGTFATKPTYWFFRHWLYVGLAWHFTSLASIDDVLGTLDAEQLFVVLWLDDGAVDCLNAPSVLDTCPPSDSSEYFFRPRGWWKSEGKSTDTFGISLDLLNNHIGAAPIPGGREAVGRVKGNISSVRELLPQANGKFNLLEKVSLL